MSKIEFRALPPMHPDLTPLRCFGLQFTGSLPAIGCLGCNHIEKWEPSDGLIGPNGSHAALTRILAHVAQCPKVLPYPAPKVETMSGEGPVAFLEVGRGDQFIAVYSPEDAA